MDIYDRLKKDHDHHRELASKIVETSGDSPERRDLWQEYRCDVEAHASAEEQTLYGALIETANGQPKARHSIAEHKEASDILEELDEMDMSSSGWLNKFNSLKEELEHHMDEEEAEVFPLSREELSASVASELVADFNQAKAAKLDVKTGS